MGLTSSLIALGDGTLPDTFKGLKSHMDLKWIKAALTKHGVATIRRRKLPVEQVVWLVIGMALYRDSPISDVVRRLDLVLPGKNRRKRRDITDGAIPQARDLVGAEPLRELFQTVAQHWALESADRHLWHGLKVLGADGTSMRVPDSAENRKAFHLPGSSRRTASYPQVRAVGLMVLRSHLLLDFDFGDYRTGEVTLASPLIERVPPHSVTILDRGFVNYLLLHRLHCGGMQRHWLVRAKKNLKWKLIRRLGHGDELVEVKFSPALRREHPELPSTFTARIVRYRRNGFRPRALMTSLLDPEQYPAAQIASLYHERWELELGYDEIKTHTLERLEAIRSQTPMRVRQEVWGLAIAYNLIRREMEAVALQQGLPPSRISFLGSLRLIREMFMWAVVAKPGRLPKMIESMRLNLAHVILPERRSERRYRRHVKIKMSSYARNDEHTA